MMKLLQTHDFKFVTNINIKVSHALKTRSRFLRRVRSYLYTRSLLCLKYKLGVTETS